MCTSSKVPQRACGKMEAYTKLGTAKEKNQFRLRWLQTKHNRKTKSKEETHEKEDELNSGREFVTAAQLRAHYESKKAARNHIRHCEQNAESSIQQVRR